MNKLVMKRKAKKAADYFFTYLLLIVIAIICAGPFIWLLLSSLRTGANIYNLHFSISDFSFSNYTGVESPKIHLEHGDHHFWRNYN